MSKYRFPLLIATLLSVFASYGLECKPGSLKSLIDNPDGLTSLTITGAIDASDIQFITQEMPALRTLDLAGVRIERLCNSETVYPEATIPAMIFAGAQLTSIALPYQDGLIIDDAAFAGTALTELTVPVSVKSTGTGAFAGCLSLKKVTLNGATEFGSDIFNGCTALTAADLGGAKTLPDAAFSGCPALTAITGTASLATIGDRAFTGCSSLTAFPFASALQAIGDEAFTHTAIKSADLADCTSLTSIGERAFAENAALSDAILPESVTSLGIGVFAMDPALSTLKLSTAITALPDYAFTSTSGVNPADVLHEGVQEIGAYAFKGHDRTECVVLPAGVTYLGDHAMEGMTGMKELDVTAHTSVPELGEDVWAGVNQKDVQLKVGANMSGPFSVAAQWQDFSIKEPTSKIDNTVVPDTKVQARFNGTLLEITSTGVEMTKVDLYTAGGLHLASLGTNSDRVEINTESRAENIYIVSVTLADGSKATAKLLRFL